LTLACHNRRGRRGRRRRRRHRPRPRPRPRPRLPRRSPSVQPQVVWLQLHLKFPSGAPALRSLR
jgi:hypothetical protein